MAILFGSRQVRRGMLDCENASFASVTDGTTNTILCIEDASRSHPIVTQFGALSNRPSPVPSSEEAPWTGGATAAAAFLHGLTLIA